MHLVDTTLFYSPTSGGVKRYLNAKHAWLREHGAHDHTLLVPGPESRCNRGGISTISGWKLPGTFNYRLPLSMSRWRQMLTDLEPDLIEVGDAFHPAWCAARVAQARDIPLIAFFHSHLGQVLARRLGAGTEEVIARYLRLLYSRCDLVLAPSRVMCEYLSHIGVRRTELQPLGVDTDVFTPERRRLDLRRTLRLHESTRLLVYAGRFSEEKNIDVMRRTMDLLGAPYHLLLIGGYRRRRISENITTLPYRRDSVELAGWLASCDALVHAGSSETFGLVVIEAMACGRPVVGVRAGAIPELVDEQVGQLAKPDDAASLAGAVCALYERDLHAMGQAARARVLRRFTWQHAFTLQLNTYARVCGIPRGNMVPQTAMD
jgi:alpha-1,6-mannosyltransferase